MKSFFDLYSEDFELSEIVALNQYWYGTNGFSMKKPRPNNALIFFSDCSGVFSGRGTFTSFEIPRGSLFFVPEGSCYDWTFYDTKKDSISTVLFEFALTDKSGVRLCGFDSEAFAANSETAGVLFNKLVCEFSRPRAVPVRIRSAAYELLTFALESGIKNTVSPNLSCIYKGIRYLEDDPRQSKTVCEIAQMCNVSVNYFERLFRQYAGCTPNEYRINKKMERAKLLLTSGDLTVGQVAAELGFDDPAYFCRVFKNKFGITPTQMKNK